MNNSAVRIDNLARSFGDLWAVRGLDLDVARGEIFGLVGPDGAGKTTTLRMLAGILSPSEGQAFVAGHSIVTEAEMVKVKIGYMSQRFGLYGDLSVEENLRFYADLYEVDPATRPALEEELLGFSNLTPFRKRLARNLSGGMKQKLGLACALIHKPEVLLLDEPTNGVDPVSRRDFWRILYSMLKQGVTIVVSTAYLDEAERCTRVGLMHEGRLILCDSPSRLKRGMAGILVEFEVADARAARAQLAQHLGADRVTLFGGRLHLYARDDAEIDAAKGWLTQAGLPTSATRRIIPSLEDVFISEVTRRAEPEAAA